MKNLIFFDTQNELILWIYRLNSISEQMNIAILSVILHFIARKVWLEQEELDIIL